jgi:hypothetical protein
MPNGWPVIIEPVSGREAFGRTDAAAVLSQAAVLLSLGAQIRGDEAVHVARAQALGFAGKTDFLPVQDADRFAVPRIQGTVGRFDIQRMQTNLAQRYGMWVLSEESAPVEAAAKSPEALQDLASRAYDLSTHQAVAELMEVSLSHPAELTRVAAAASYLELSNQPQRLIRILAKGCRSSDALVREVAATALAHTAPDHPALNSLKSAQRAVGAGAEGGWPPNTALLVHGTWAANETWWQPGGDFHTYFLKNVRSDLYDKSDRFGWSGAYSDGARLLGAQDLLRWVTNHNENGLDLITHSHGGSIAMLATHNGLQVGELVLLSCPVHIPKYMPDFTKVKKTVSIRVHFDLVILADRGGQRFQLPEIQENVLPVWFNHSATHDPSVWTKNKVPSML